MTADFDIAVIGSGPAGANAALQASAAGKSVALIDEQPKPGGQVWRAKSAAILQAPLTPETRAGDALRHDVGRSGIHHFGLTRVWQIERDEGFWHLHLLCDGMVRHRRMRALILATGAREFVQPVPGWTTPGVLGLAGATALFKQDLTVPGKRTVVAGTGPLVFFVASEVRRLGGRVAAVITPNTRRDWMGALPSMRHRPDLMARGALWIADLLLAGVPIKWGHAVTSVSGSEAVTGATYRKLGPDWSARGTEHHLDADSLCLGNGLIPSVEAAELAGLVLRHDPSLGGWVPEASEDGATAIEGLFICGDGAGIRGVSAAEIHGRLAGLAAAISLGADVAEDQDLLRKNYRRAARFGLAMTQLGVPRAGLATLADAGTIICRCEGLTRGAIQAEITSGAGSANAVKSGIRAGMGPCGGKFCQAAIAGMIARTEGRAESAVPPPMSRPPLRPVPVQALAGDFSYGDLPIPKPAPL